MKHCVVKIGDQIIPLIGVPVESGLEKCDWCEQVFHLWEILYWNGQFICEICRRKWREKIFEKSS